MRSVFLSLVLGFSSLFANLSFAGEGYPEKVQVQTVLKTATDGAGRPLKYPDAGTPQITGVLVEVPPGENTGWHRHSWPCVGYILEGEISVEIDGRKPEYFKAGQSFAEVVNLRHCGFNRSTKPVRILMFAIGEQGVPISEPVAK